MSKSRKIGGYAWKNFKYARWMMTADVFTTTQLAEEFKINANAAWELAEIAADAGLLEKVGKAKGQGTPMQYRAAKELLDATRI